MAKIVRTKSRAEGGITDKERELMAEHSRLWISRALRTDPIEPEKIIPAIEGLYSVAGLKKPRVVIVPSPLVMAFAYGAAATIWATDLATRQATDLATRQATYLATDQATRQTTDQVTDQATYLATGLATRQTTDQATRLATRLATRQATRQATYQATDLATDQATYLATRLATGLATRLATYLATRQTTDQATRLATRLATRQATDLATDLATRQATRQATDQVTDQATYLATRLATRQATRQATYQATRQAESGAAQACLELAGQDGLNESRNWYNVYQGGNMWAGYDCYLTSCRDILGLELASHAAYKYWEDASIHGGFRVMHEEFCMVCDFPKFIHMDNNNEPHCEDGPSHRWRDGWELFHWHGIAVPGEWIMNKNTIHPSEIIKAENVEQRAAGAEIIGWPRMLEELESKTIDDSGSPDIGSLIEMTLPGLDKPGRFLKAECPRNGTIVEGVPYTSEIDNLPINTALAAQAWRIGDPQSEYQHPPKRT